MYIITVFTAIIISQLSPMARYLQLLSYMLVCEQLLSYTCMLHPMPLILTQGAHSSGSRLSVWILYSWICHVHVHSAQEQHNTLRRGG